MNSTRFEWDADKAASNLLAHGVAFDRAALDFGDAFSLEWLDEREAYGEERVNLLGMSEGILLHVTYTTRGEIIRIISARRAERHEHDHYFRENSS
jgi:uncharacterized protein